MTYDKNLLEPVELADAELDMVAAGQVGISGGLVNLVLNDVQIDALRDANITVLEGGVTVRDVAIANDTNVGAIVAILGRGGVIAQRT
jgi:hypothetical protein